MLFNLLVVSGHSWMSCPLPFNTNPSRGGILTPSCEAFTSSSPTNKVSPGDRLKVGWVSNNHGGGYVKLSFVPFDSINELTFQQNVLKLACYGIDERPGRYAYGDCVHPCNGRGGCDYQKSTTDIERFDTTVKIPMNLKAGKYVLQWTGLVGNAFAPYYGCSLIEIQTDGPYVGKSCLKNALPSNSAPGCVKSGGPAVETILKNTKFGDFCFADPSSTEATNVDIDIGKQPVNYDCDPRVGCSLSVNPALCASDLQGIADSSNPKQICLGAPSATTTIKASTTTTKAFTTTVKASTTKASTTTIKASTTTSSKSSSTSKKSTTTAPATTTAASTPTNIPNGCPAIVEPETQCTPGTDYDRCYGTDFIRCAPGVINNKATFLWKRASCAPGTQCRPINNGLGFLCDWPGNGPVCPTNYDSVDASSVTAATDSKTTENPTFAKCGLPVADKQLGCLQGEYRCVGDGFFQCDNNVWIQKSCASGTHCQQRNEFKIECTIEAPMCPALYKRDRNCEVIPEDTECETDSYTCSGRNYVQCVGNKYKNRLCGAGTQCNQLSASEVECGFLTADSCPFDAKAVTAVDKSNPLSWAPPLDCNSNIVTGTECNQNKDTPVCVDSTDFAVCTSKGYVVRSCGEGTYCQSMEGPGVICGRVSSCSNVHPFSTASTPVKTQVELEPATEPASNEDKCAITPDNSPCDFAVDTYKCSGVDFVQCTPNNTFAALKCPAGLACQSIQDGGITCGYPTVDSCNNTSVDALPIDKSNPYEWAANKGCQSSLNIKNSTTCEWSIDTPICVSETDFAICGTSGWAVQSCSAGLFCESIEGAGATCSYSPTCNATDSVASIADVGTNENTSATTESCNPLVDLTETCSENDYKCNGHGFVQCSNGKWIEKDCSSGTICRPDALFKIICDWPSQVDCNSTISTNGTSGELNVADVSTTQCAAETVTASVFETITYFISSHTDSEGNVDVTTSVAIKTTESMATSTYGSVGISGISRSDSTYYTMPTIESSSTIDFITTTAAATNTDGNVGISDVSSTIPWITDVALPDHTEGYYNHYSSAREQYTQSNDYCVREIINHSSCSTEGEYKCSGRDFGICVNGIG
eukprot:NODE_239_length_13273_cov_0.404964.p1 type:complete len:1101 gc:universal NODE_239_length_13273_cov_0.404964:7318-4016(-)